MQFCRKYLVYSKVTLFYKHKQYSMLVKLKFYSKITVHSVCMQFYNLIFKLIVSMRNLHCNK